MKVKVIKTPEYLDSLKGLIGYQSGLSLYFPYEDNKERLGTLWVDNFSLSFGRIFSFDYILDEEGFEVEKIE